MALSSNAVGTPANASRKDIDSDKARKELISDMNHDLRTPLNAVIGFAELIENEMFGKVQPEYLEYAKHIRESGYDLLAKIEDLLDPYGSPPNGSVPANYPKKKLVAAE